MTSSQRSLSSQGANVSIAKNIGKAVPVFDSVERESFTLRFTASGQFDDDLHPWGLAAERSAAR